jgi:CBS domain-containing protein
MELSGTVADILQRKSSEVWTIAPEATVFEAIALMGEKNVGALLVLEKNQVVGIISERDYSRKIILQGKSSKETLIREIMTTEVICASPQETVENCMRLMTERRIRHMPVMENQKLKGVVSMGDLVNWIIGMQRETIDTLEGYISGRYPG